MPKITDAQLWELFTGCGEPAECFNSGRWSTMDKTTRQREIEAVRKAVAVVSPQLDDLSTYLLRLIWIREKDFGIRSTAQRNFFEKALKYANAGIGIKGLDLALISLASSEYIKPTGATVYGEEESYFLAPNKIGEVEEWFNTPTKFRLPPPWKRPWTGAVSIPPSATVSIPDDAPPIQRGSTPTTASPNKTAAKRQSTDEINGKVEEAIRLYIGNPKMTKKQLELAVGLSKKTLTRNKKAKGMLDRATATNRPKRDKDGRLSD